MIYPPNSTSSPLFRMLHGTQVVRKIAKRLMRGVTVTQDFHGGAICCDAVDHSWAWVHGQKYELFDRDLQDCLLRKSYCYDFFVDIGCNVGAMTLSCLLRNPSIRAICVDPNKRAIELLRRSVKLNQLEHRVMIIQAAMSQHDGFMKFDESGSVTGHVSDTGTAVKCLDFALHASRFIDTGSCLIKMDVEGFESQLLQTLSSISSKARMFLVVELHPKGWNGVGDPRLCIDLLSTSGASLTDLRGAPLGIVDEEVFTQVCASW